MKSSDLTHTISEDMPVFPGSETPKLTTRVSKFSRGLEFRGQSGGQ